MSQCPTHNCGGEMHLHCERCGLRVGVPTVLAPASNTKAAMSRYEVARSEMPLRAKFPFGVTEVTENGSIFSALDVNATLGQALGAALKRSAAGWLPTLLNNAAVKYLVELSPQEMFRGTVSGCTRHQVG